MSSIPFELRPRAVPLEPSALIARGRAARELAERLLHLEEAQLGALSGVSGTNLLALIGSDLPWVDGVEYFGRDARSPSLFWPTHSEPSIHPSLVERALTARTRNSSGPFAVLFNPEQIVPLGDALPVARARLERWLRESSG